MLCQNALLFKFSFPPGNKETIVEIFLTIEATQFYSDYLLFLLLLCVRFVIDKEAKRTIKTNDLRVSL